MLREDRNEPLLPRSQSYSALGTIGSWVAALRKMCDGDYWRMCDAVRGTAMVGTTLVCIVGLLGSLNPLALLSPLHWLTSMYLCALSCAAIAYELEVFERYRRWVGVYLRGLTRPSGRGAFYIFLGTLAAGLGDPLAIVAGCAEIGAGIACVYSLGAVPDDASEAGSEISRHSEGDAARAAFRRRVAFGTEQLDSAECGAPSSQYTYPLHKPPSPNPSPIPVPGRLVALCLELGLPLDTRARVAALDVLDPTQQGVVSEDAFLAWWETQRTVPRPLSSLRSLR